VRGVLEKGNEMIEEIIKKYIYVDDHKPEYLVVLPRAADASMFMYHESPPPPTKAELIVAVYRYAGRTNDPHRYCYEFVGVEIR
jgi:hypothetical protein